MVVTPQNVIKIATKCNKIFNAKCNNLSTQIIVITFLTHNVITQNVPGINFRITTCGLFQNRYCGSVISS